MKFLHCRSNCPRDDISSQNNSVSVAFALTDNSVQLWQLSSDNNREISRKSTVSCVDRSLLYCISLYGGCEHSLKVACGTVFNQIIVWDVSSGLSAEKLSGNDIKENSENAVDYSGRVSRLEQKLFKGRFV